MKTRNTNGTQTLRDTLFGSLSVLLATACAASPQIDATGEDASAASNSEAKLSLSAEASSDAPEDDDPVIEAFRARLPELIAIQDRFEPELFAQPGVTSLGIGLADDWETPVFRIAVSEASLLSRIPPTFDGVPVVTRVTGEVRLLDGGPQCNGGEGPPCHAEQQPLPVEMGNSGGWFLGGSCTLGFKACDLATGDQVFVTASHCAQYPVGCKLADIGDPFTHVGPGDGVDTVTIGYLAGHAAPSCGSSSNFTDATKVTSGPALTSSAQRDIGPVSGPLFSLGAYPGRKVHYSGRTSGYNKGTIAAVHVTVQVPDLGGFCCGALTMKDQLSFVPKNKVLGGDSGSGVLIDKPNAPDNRVAGLLWGNDGTNAYMNNVKRIAAALNVSLALDQCSPVEAPY